MSKIFEITYGFFLRIFKIQAEPSANARRIASNAGWLFLDSAIRSGVGFFIGVAIARYLGPEQYGILSYCVAFVFLLSSLANLGLDSIVIRDIVLEPDLKNEIIGTAFILKLSGGVIAFAAAVIAASFIQHANPLFRWLIGIIALSMIFQPTDVVDFYFQAKVLSKYTIWIRDGVSLAFSAVRIVFIFMRAPLEYFAYAVLAEAIFVSAGLLLIYRFRENAVRPGAFSWPRTIHLFKNCWPNFFSGIAVMIYMKIDQLMIEAFSGAKELGIYAAAVRILEIGYVPGLILTATVFPILLEFKKSGESAYQARLKKVYQALIVTAIALIILVFLFSKAITVVLYGPQFERAAGVLTIIISAVLVVYLGLISSYDILSEGLQKYGFYRAALGAIASIFLNLGLIQWYGIKGAAWALILSQCISVFSLGLFKATRKHFLCLMQALVEPFLLYRLKKS